jgi:guanylate kinase
MNMPKRFATLSGPACVGKGPLQTAVRRFYPGLIDARPILCTSRPARRGEDHGKHYYFLPASFIRSLDKSTDFVVSPVRSDWQAIHLPQVDELLQQSELVFAEVYYTFGPALLQRAASRQFDGIRVLLLPLPAAASPEQLVEVMKEKLTRRRSDAPEKIEERAALAPTEVQQPSAYTHRIINPAGEDDVEEWGELGTRDGKPGLRPITAIHDLGPNARWLVETFVSILRGELPPGDYQR